MVEPLDDAHTALAEADASGTERMREFTVWTFIHDIPRFADPLEVQRWQHLADGLRRAGFREHLDEAADSGVPATSELQAYTELDSPTPMTVPGGTTIQTAKLASMLQ
jgi:hypothetical protein